MACSPTSLLPHCHLGKRRRGWHPFFTALNNGLISALISFLRTLVFQIGAVLLLPLVFELDGIWWSVVAAELGSLALTAFFMMKYRRRYHYG